MNHRKQLITLAMESATQMIVFLSNGLKVRYRLAIDEFADLDLKVELVL